MSLKKNVIANYLGQGWTAIMGFVFVPLYIKYLGMESYGLIGVFVMLQAWLGLLDMGMTPTLNREMARYTAGAHNAQSIRDLLRSLEVICFITALLITIVVWLCATWLSRHWLQVEKLSTVEVAKAISIMGAVVALRFVEGLYRGAIIGLQKQVWLNVAAAGLATLRAGGAALLLVWVLPSIEVFFLWQGIASVLTILVFMLTAYRHLPVLTQSAKFSWLQLKKVWRFASGMMVISLSATLLLQVDKIVLSQLLSLEDFGYYSLAGTIVTALNQLSGPVSQALYPRFTELITKEDITRLADIYHQGSQLICVLIIPAALMLVFFGENILLLWTNNGTLTQNTLPILALLAVGNMLNGVMQTPFMLTFSYGWSVLVIRQNIIAILFLVPTIIWIAPRYGAIGVAWIWVILNLGYVLISIPLIHQRLLKTEKWHWYWFDFILPLLGSLVIISIFWRVQPKFTNQLLEIGWLLACGSCAVISSLLNARNLRKLMFKRLSF